MGRPRKAIDNGFEVELDEPEPIMESAQSEPSDARIAYIKNGVTILRFKADENRLLDDGWVRR